MNTKYVITTVLFIANMSHASIGIKALNHKAIPLVCSAVALTEQERKELLACANVIKRDCEFMGQFAPRIEVINKRPESLEAIKAYYKIGVPFVLILSEPTQNQDVIEWRLYDTMQGKMLCQKSSKKSGTSLAGTAHAIADELWQTLTNQPGIFSTKLVYCKRERVNESFINTIWVADYDGRNKKKFIDTQTINVAPRWNADPHHPVIFYSSYLDAKMQLMMCDMQKHTKVTSGFDGLNMQAAFSPDGKQVVYCSSRADGQCQLYHCVQGKLRQLTHNAGNNISPTFSHDGKTIFFCSDYKGKGPQLYAYHLENNTMEEIMDGSCATPRYCVRNHCLAFSKVIDGEMQLFIYNVDTKKTQQITFTQGNKEESSWSPCGNYLIYVLHDGAQSRIVQMNLITKKERYVTQASDYCSYPDWSPTYARYPAT